MDLGTRVGCLPSPPPSRSSELDDATMHDFMNIRDLITETRKDKQRKEERERGGEKGRRSGEGTLTEGTAGWRFQDKMPRIRGEQPNSPYMKQI